MEKYFVIVLRMEREWSKKNEKKQHDTKKEKWERRE